jgi:hypothetical protein
MDLTRAPLFERLASARRVLVAGAGGGFDVLCGLPLMHALEGQGKEVQLASLSFADLDTADGARLGPGLVQVGSEAGGSETYFPEKFLSRWFATEGREVQVWCFAKTGVRPMVEAYRALVDHLAVDAVVLVDGGTDSLMRGDEAGLGTPVEDVTSIAAVHALEIPTKLLACVGFGVDAFHGVSHAHFLEAVAALSRDGAYLGSFALLPQMEEVRRYLDAVDWVHRAMPARPSIVNASIASAVEGHYGDYHRTERTRGSRLWINPIMAQCFAFELDAVARRCLYLERIAHTRTAFEVAAVIDGFRREIPIRPREPIEG